MPKLKYLEPVCCSNPTQPNDWIGICKLCLKLGCRRCLFINNLRVYHIEEVADNIFGVMADAAGIPRRLLGIKTQEES